MKVTIITVVFNSRRFITDCIRSVRAQDYRDIEYIIIDGASTDGTIDIINSFSHAVDHFVSEKDNGIYDAMNKAIGMATGNLIGILNSDDFYVHRKVISDVVRQIEESGADTLYADLVYVDPIDTDRVKRLWHSGAYKPGIFKWGWMPPHPTFFVKKKVYEQYGAFDLRLRSAADYELMLRFLHKNRVSTTYLSEIIIKMREGGMSNTSVKNRLKANLEDRLAWAYNDLRPYFFTLIIKPLRKIIQFIGKPAILRSEF